MTREPDVRIGYYLAKAKEVQRMPTALIIDDHPESLLELSKVASDCGFLVNTAQNLEEARARLAQRWPDVAVLNLQIGEDEEAAFRLFSRADLENTVELYLVSAEKSFEAARRGMRIGAADYFQRPIDLDRLRENFNAVIREIRSTASDRQGMGASGHGLLIGESPAMDRVLRMIQKVAPTQATVFLAGESGSGKELVARAIHDRSGRSDGPFIAMNCGAIPSELIESEMFGHRKGAFTGANSNHKGYFERAAGGSLLLDEVTEMNPDLQVKLLRVLETRRIQPVGGEREQSIDVRIIASTNRDPETAISEGTLREDLYYRLAEFPLRVPPLRERGEDVILLAEAFLNDYNRREGEDKVLSQEVAELLRLHDWPGNVRELKNAVSRGAILASDEIEPDDLPGSIPSGSGMRGDYLRFAVGNSLKEVERRMILATVDHFEGDKPRAAKALGISLKTLYNRLKSYSPKG